MYVTVLGGRRVLWRRSSKWWGEVTLETYVTTDYLRAKIFWTPDLGIRRRSANYSAKNNYVAKIYVGVLCRHFIIHQRDAIHWIFNQDCRLCKCRQLYRNFSRTLPPIFSRVIGRYLEGPWLSSLPGLVTGIILAIFQFCGKHHRFKNSL